jgi:hypothetical protein
LHESAGGYEVRTIRPTTQSSTTTVAGTIFDTNGQLVARTEVEVFSSMDPMFRVMTNTDAQRR